MRRNTVQAMAVLGLSLLGACSSEKGAQSLGPVPTAPSTTVAPTTTSTRPPATTSTTSRAVTTTRLIAGIPQVTTVGPCNIVAFTPNSDDAASDIVATGMGCAEAEALVRQVDTVAGLARARADGWVCRQVRQSDGPGLAYAVLECVNGPKKVTYRRY